MVSEKLVEVVSYVFRQKAGVSQMGRDVGGFDFNSHAVPSLTLA